ncbi:MAG: hypothetical protein HY015_02865 [Bacteroidetes bacterium]|nr:hypothetical protein [Bacteroidota bacterium]MBI3481911.1 hypothetical protein [Bacteroidota bacterium]
MKKIVFSAMSILLLANTYSLARRSIKGELTFVQNQKDEKEKIKKEELPEEARKTLDGDAFKGWTIMNVYKKKNGEFEVELKKGTSAQSVKFDKDGKAK